MMKWGTLVLLFVPIMAISAVHQKSSQSKYVMCKNQKIVRTLRIERKQNGEGCQTTYTKAGIDRIVGSSSLETGCQPFLENVKGNLEKAAWKCKDISNAKISYTSDIIEE